MNSKLILLTAAIFLCSFTKEEPKVIETLFGPCPIEDSLIQDLLDTSAMKRLQSIDQHGIGPYLHGSPTFDRYSHSVSVYHLLKMQGVSLHEQAAGLLHDASHTVFSHLAETIFSVPDSDVSYQDSIHEWYLVQNKIPDVLEKYGIHLSDILYKKGGCPALEQPLPDMCADRIEYNLHTGYVFGLIDKKDIQDIIHDLHYMDERWFFEDPLIAKKFASISLYMTEHFWGSHQNAVISYWAAKAIKRAVLLELISKDDLHFSIDRLVLDQLLSSDDPLIKDAMLKCRSYVDTYSISTEEDYDWFVRFKCRGIDPWVRIGSGFSRLTELDHDFAKETKRVKDLIQKGWYIKFKKDAPEVSNQLSLHAESKKD